MRSVKITKWETSTSSTEVRLSNWLRLCNWFQQNTNVSFLFRFSLGAVQFSCSKRAVRFPKQQWQQLSSQDLSLGPLGCCQGRGPGNEVTMAVGHGIFQLTRQCNKWIEVGFIEYSVRNKVWINTPMPRHLIREEHEWMNEVPTFPIHYLAIKPHGRMKK